MWSSLQWNDEGIATFLATVVAVAVVLMMATALAVALVGNVGMFMAACFVLVLASARTPINLGSPPPGASCCCSTEAGQAGACSGATEG